MWCFLRKEWCTIIVHNMLDFEFHMSCVQCIRLHPSRPACCDCKSQHINQLSNVKWRGKKVLFHVPGKSFHDVCVCIPSVHNTISAKTPQICALTSPMQTWSGLVLIKFNKRKCNKAQASLHNTSLKWWLVVASSHHMWATVITTTHAIISCNHSILMESQYWHRPWDNSCSVPSHNSNASKIHN